MFTICSSPSWAAGAPVTYIGEPGSVALRLCLGGQCLGRATDTTRMATLGQGVGHDKDPPRGLWDRIECTHWSRVVPGGCSYFDEEVWALLHSIPAPLIVTVPLTG